MEKLGSPTRIRVQKSVAAPVVYLKSLLTDSQSLLATTHSDIKTLEIGEHKQNLAVLAALSEQKKNAGCVESPSKLICDGQPQIHIASMLQRAENP